MFPLCSESKSLCRFIKLRIYDQSTTLSIGFYFIANDLAYSKTYPKPNPQKNQNKVHWPRRKK